MLQTLNNMQLNQ
jgi:hypothetical protein